MNKEETVWILFYRGSMDEYHNIIAVFKKKPSFEKYCELTHRDVSIILECDDAEDRISDILREMKGDIGHEYELIEVKISDHHKKESE